MSDYSVQANWSEKDALPSGDANKRVRASEHATEYAAIASAIASKADSTDVTDKALQADLTALETTVTGISNNHVNLNSHQTITANKTFSDDAKLQFGTTADLKIFHNGSDSVIEDSGTGILKYTSDTTTSYGSVFEIENTSDSTYAGAYVSFKSDSGDTPVVVGSAGANILAMILGGNPSHSFGTDYLEFKDGQNNARIIIGTGAPENNVGAVVGSLFLRTDGGIGATLYVKESGTGNTGWQAK